MKRLQVSAELNLELVTGKKSEINNPNPLNSSVTFIFPFVSFFNSAFAQLHVIAGSATHSCTQTTTKPEGLVPDQPHNKIYEG